MRILLTANASYVPPRGGATRSNLLWLEHLAARGHECRVVAAALADAPEKREQIRDEQMHLDWSPLAAEPGVEVSRRGSIAVYSVAERSRQLAVLREQIREFQPDWVLVSSEDLGHVLLRARLAAAPGRIVYLAHTPQFFPFGPASWNPDAEGTELVARAAAVVAIGHHTAAYIRQHTGRAAAVIHPPIYGAGPFPNLGSFDRGPGHHGQSVRGEGHLDLPGAGRPLPAIRLRRPAGMGHDQRRSQRARKAAPTSRCCPTADTSRSSWSARACC